MALPAIMRRLFAGDGYGPLLKDDIVSRRISIQDWSSSFDYQPATAVRGSDGRSYWSVAQSGPGTGAGAVDPTTDGGAYWGPMPVRTPGLGVAGSYPATVEWVRALAVAPVYLDPAGSDANDGMTEATAVQTFSRAISIAAGLPQSGCRLIVKGGAYTGNLDISEKTIAIELQGNVSIAGRIQVIFGSILSITGQNLSFSLTANNVEDAILISRSSSFFCSVNLNISTNASISAIRADDNSSLWFGGSVSINSNSPNGYGIFLSKSNADFLLQVSLGGTALMVGVQLQTNASALFAYGLTIANDLVAGTAVDVNESSGCEISSKAASPSIIYGGASTLYTILVNNNSHFTLSGDGLCSIYYKGFAGGSCIVAIGSSIVSVVDLSFNQIVSGSQFVLASNNSRVAFSDGAISFAGTVAQTVYSTVCSCLSFSYLTSLSGSPTGKRFSVDRCSVIDSGGGGVNFIPGTADGTADATSFGYYG